MARRVRLDVGPAEVRLIQAMAGALRTRAAAVAARQRELEAVGPRSVLKRGYSVTTREDGTVVKHESDVRAGEAIITRLAAGRIRSFAEGQAAPPEPRPQKRRPTSPAPDEPGLFGAGEA